MYLSSKYQPSQQTELLSRHSVRSFNVQRPCKMQHSCSKLSPCICRHISWFCHIRYGGAKVQLNFICDPANRRRTEHCICRCSA